MLVTAAAGCRPSGREHRQRVVVIDRSPAPVDGPGTVEDDMRVSDGRPAQTVAGDAPQPRGATGLTLRDLLLASPRWVGTAIVTLLSVIVSVTLAFVAAGTLLPEPHYPVALSIAAVIPLLVATPISWFLIGLYHELDAARAEAQRTARTDLLTGALNRRRFVELAERELARATIDGTAVSLILLDIDNFKRINDRYGHRVGDDVLRHVAQACAATLRPGDHLARWGGEEFVALLPRVGLADAVNLANRLRLAVSDCTYLGLEEPISISASLGVSSTDLGTRALDRLTVLADHAMYEVKRQGKDGVRAAVAVAPGA